MSSSGTSPATMRSRQPERAPQSMGAFFAITIVILESEWMLRSVYGFGTTEVAAALRSFSGLPNVSVESPVLLAEALDRAQMGMDFADALRLGAASRCEAMLAFDRQFICWMPWSVDALIPSPLAWKLPCRLGSRGFPPARE